MDTIHDGLRRVECHEVDELMLHLRGISAVAVPLRPGRFASMLTSCDLGDVSIQIIRSAPMLVLGAASNGRTALVEALEGSGQVRWNGAPVEAGSIAICRTSTPYEAVYPDDFACSVISFADKALASTAELSRGTPGSAPRPHPDAHSGFAVLSHALEKMIVSCPFVLDGPEARRSLRAQLLETAGNLLTSPREVQAQRSRDGRTRQRIVHDVDEYLRANPARPVYTDELCSALGISATRLHQAFHATFGISPHRYLKMRRMAMVRGVLLSRDGPCRSVKAAALSHGFWHLGQFAHDYRALYGECPSETLVRAWPGHAPAAEGQSL